MNENLFEINAATPFNSVAPSMPNTHSNNVNDTFMNSILQELKSIKLTDTFATENINEKKFSVGNTERAIVKAKDFNASNNKPMHSTTGTYSSQWASPQSPGISSKSLYHKSDGYNTSKESLWASTQSSPNSAQREQSKQQFKKSSSTPANLWESPISKLSQATLMIKNDSNSSIWYTPPQVQSPAVSSGQNYWDCSSSFLNGSIDNCTSDGVNLLRPQDLSPNEVWNNNASITNSHRLSVKTDLMGSMWPNTSPIGKTNSNIFTSTPIKSSMMESTQDRNKANFDINNAALAPAISSASNAMNAASSSCMQLFSDEFINYLNMIN